MITPVETKDNHLAHIDALRGVAVLMVVAIHTGGWIKPESSAALWFTHSGHRGVQLFYIISGFTLFWAFGTKPDDSLNWRHVFTFWARRFFRIAPMFYVAIAGSLYYFGWGIKYWAPNGISTFEVASTVTFLNAWIPEAITAIVPGGWSVAIEMNFYLLLPFLFRLVTSMRRAIAAFFLSLLVFYVWRFSLSSLFAAELKGASGHVYYNFIELFSLPANLPVFSLGIVLYHLMPRLQSFKARHGHAAEVAGYLISLCGLIALGYSSYTDYWFWFPKHIEQSIYLLVFTVGVSLYPTRLIVNPLLILIGELSFSIYLNHQIVLPWVSQRAQGMLPEANSDLRYICAFVLVTSVSVVVAFFTYHAWEVPMRRWGYRLVKHTLGSGDGSEHRA